MKLMSLGMALTMLSAGAAFAAAPSPTTTAAAPMTAMPAAHKSTKECTKEAESQKLSTKDREAFVKKCKSGQETKY